MFLKHLHPRHTGILTGQCEMERRTFSFFALSPYASAVVRYDSSTDGEPDSCPGVFVVLVQTLEDPENALRIGGVESNSVIYDRENVFVARRFRTNLHDRRYIVLPVFQSVSD